MDSADAEYQRVREQWEEIVELSVYDDAPIVTSVASQLDGIRRRHPDHVPTLRLLCSLLLEIGATAEAREVGERLIALDPDNPYAQKMWEFLTKESDYGERVTFLARFWRNRAAW